MQANCQTSGPAVADRPATTSVGLLSRHPLRTAVVLAVLFFLVSALTLPLLTRWRGDERYYTDAAIRMVQTGDYLTPYDSDGTVRFNKPVLNYWLIAGCFHAFGINVFAARVAQLVFGSLALLAVYRLASALFERRDVALLAVAAMAVNEPCLNASIRATTDIVQYCLLTLSLAGFAALLFRERRGVTDYVLAYGGLASAALTKGGMAAVLLAFVAGFNLWLRRRYRAHPTVPVPPRLSAVVPWYGVLLAITPFAIWLGLSFRTHGDAAVRELWFDQVSRRIEGSASFVLDNLLAYGTGPFVALFPWVGLLALAGWKRWPVVRQLVAERRAEVTFAVAWFLTVAAVIIPGNITRTRYLLPTFPMLAATIAYVLVCLTDRSPAASRVTGLAARIVAIGILVFGLVLTLVGARLAPDALVGGLAVALAGAATAWWLARRPPVLIHWVPVALLAVAAYRLTDVSIRSHLFAVPAYDVVRQMDANFGDSKGTSLATVGLADEAAHVRLVSAGRIAVTNLRADATPAATFAFDAVLVPGSSVLDLGPGYRSVPAGLRCDRWRPQDLARFALGLTTVEEVYARRGNPVRLLIRQPVPPRE